MKNLHDQSNKTAFKNSASSVRRVHAKTKKANGSSSNLLLHASSILETRETTHVKDAGRERLKRYREEVAGRVLIPETWGQEDLLKDWIDCSAFEALLVPNKIASARKALVADGR